MYTLTELKQVPHHLSEPGGSIVKSPWHSTNLCQGLILLGTYPASAQHDVSGSSGPWDEVLLVSVLVLVVVALVVLGVTRGKEDKRRK